MNPHYELITDSLGNKRVGAFVTVKDYPSGAVSTIYTTDGLTVQSNPLTSDGDGYVKFSVPDGKYSFSVSYAGVASTTPPITIGGPEAAGGNSVLAALAASTGLALSGTSSGNNAQVEMNLKPTNVASVAALNAATTASLPSGFIYLQSYNAGQNQGGGMLVKLASPVTPDNVMTFNDASGASYQRLGVNTLTPEMAGCDPTATTDCKAALSALDALGKPYVLSGQYRVSSNLALSQKITFIAGGQLVPDTGVTITLAGGVDAPFRQAIFAGSGTCTLTIPQTVYPEWWTGSDPEDARANTYAGSVIDLAAVTYMTRGIALNSDSTAVGGGDTGKVIQGPTAPNRYAQSPASAFFGAVIKLNTNANVDVIKATGNTSGGGTGASFTQIALRRFMIHGGSQSATSNGFNFTGKDLLLEDMYIFAARDYGITQFGSTNQLNVKGFLEVWNCGLTTTKDGINGAALGDFQWPATVRCVNNGRHGAYFGAGYGHIDSLFCYFNQTSGMRYDASTANGTHFHINYYRGEDNNNNGIEIAGNNLHIDDCFISGNGVTGSSGTSRAGIYSSGVADRIRIGKLHTGYRTGQPGGITQQYAIYDSSTGTDKSVGVFDDTTIYPEIGTAQAGSATTLTLASYAGSATDRYTGCLLTATGGTGAGQSATVTAYNGTTKVCTFAAVATPFDNTTVYSITNAYPSTGNVIFNTKTDGTGWVLDKRRTFSGTYASVKDAGATITPRPAQFQRYIVTGISESMTLSTASASTLSSGMDFSIKFTATGAFNLNFSADYVDATGGALAAIALASGTRSMTFKRSGGKWQVVTSIAS